MMADQLPETARDVPRVVFTERVIEKILRGALLYPDMETGEALIGLVVPQAGRSEPDIYVLDTIGPGDQAVREWGMFEQGDDWQGDVLHWLHVNWEAFRELRRSSYGNALAAKWDVPLMHVGDWHKQPGNMIAPSGGDEQTGRRMINDRETPVEYLIAPIVTMYPLHDESDDVGAAISVSTTTVTAQTPAEDAESSDAQAEAKESGVVESFDITLAPAEPMPEEKPNTIIRTLEDEGWRVRIDCWYMSKRQKRFVATVPIVWPNDRLPGLPALAWHLAYPRRFDQEFSLLKDAGYMVDVVRFDADGRPPYEICFSVYRSGNDHVILLVTSSDYPTAMPAIRIAPLVSVDEGEDVFEKLYEASRPVLMTELPDWEWDSKRTLIELVWHIEKLLNKDGGEA